jgi:hypothetical protein
MINVNQFLSSIIITIMLVFINSISRYLSLRIKRLFYPVYSSFDNHILMHSGGKGKEFKLEEFIFEIGELSTTEKPNLYSIFTNNRKKSNNTQKNISCKLYNSGSIDKGLPTKFLVNFFDQNGLHLLRVDKLVRFFELDACELINTFENNKKNINDDNLVYISVKNLIIKKIGELLPVVSTRNGNQCEIFRIRIFKVWRIEGKNILVFNVYCENFQSNPIFKLITLRNKAKTYSFNRRRIILLNREIIHEQKILIDNYSIHEYLELHKNITEYI